MTAHSHDGSDDSDALGPGEDADLVFEPGSSVLLVETDGGLDDCLPRLGRASADVLVRAAYAPPREPAADAWRRRFDREPAATVDIVAADLADGGFGDGSQTVNPGDFTGLGVELSRALDRSERAGRRATLCFDSLNVALQYGSERTVFKFLHTLTGLLRQADAFAHFHVDPRGIDDRTFATLRGLFDAVATVHEDGTVDVKRR